jgi:hypothetical protein
LICPSQKIEIRFWAFPKYIYCRFLLIGYKRRSLGKGYGTWELGGNMIEPYGT